ncbi:MAG: DUF4169 family protein [Pseudomonadota bacterium]
MADIINLRQKRKQVKRETKSANAEENRVRFGRTKAQKELDRRQLKASDDHLDAHHLDAHRLDRPDDA